MVLREGWERYPFSGNPEELEGFPEKDTADGLTATH